MKTVPSQIIKRVRSKGRGSIFRPKDFLDLGTRAAVDQALSRLARRGTIRRLGHGLYDYPRISPRLGPLSPTIDALAKALTKQTDSRLQISGARAVNTLGLSTQVPAQAIYLTDGPSRRIRVGSQVIDLRHAVPRHLVGAGKTTGMVLQALRYLGRDGIDHTVTQKLGRTLSASDKVALKRDAIHAPDWTRPVIDQIIQVA